ncbi:MAG: cytochrome c biogenesis CcdA family protein [Thermoplasmatota archaeon]
MAADTMTIVTPGVAFLAGLVSFLSPCVLPVVPGYVAFVTGGAGTWSRRAGLTVAFVLGFGLAFVILGVAVGALGQATDFTTYKDIVQRVGGALIIAFGLAMTGLLRLPFMDRDFRYHGQAPKAAGPVGGALILGAAFGVGWSPCVGPILASILIVAGTQASVGQAGLLLAAYALGLAIPFLVVGLSAERGASILRKFHRVTRGIEIVGGVVLIILGIFVFTGSLTRFLSYLPVGSA